MASALEGLKILLPESRRLDLFTALLEDEGAVALRCGATKQGFWPDTLSTLIGALRHATLVLSASPTSCPSS
jgi:hypothetical protein